MSDAIGGEVAVTPSDQMNSVRGVWLSRWWRLRVDNDTTAGVSIPWYASREIVFEEV